MIMSSFMSSDVGWHIRDKLWPVPKHGSVLPYVHRNRKAYRTEGPGRPPRLSYSSGIVLEDVPLVELVLLVFIRMPDDSYRKQLRSSLLCLYDVFLVLINSLVCWFFAAFEEKGDKHRTWTRVCPLISLAPCRWAQPFHVRVCHAPPTKPNVQLFHVVFARGGLARYA